MTKAKKEKEKKVSNIYYQHGDLYLKRDHTETIAQSTSYHS